MAMSVRDFLQSPKGKFIGASIGVLGLLIAIWMIKNTFADPAAQITSERVFVDSETGKPFDYTMKRGDTVPVKSPHTGRNTGYIGERCYWTKDGTIKDKPTFVILNSPLRKPEPTFCPDCGRLVRPFNPKPNPGDKPPPTEAEYKAKNPGRTGNTGSQPDAP